MLLYSLPNDYHLISGHEFLGDQIVIFYEYKFGFFPYYNEYDPNQPVNGGLPQVRLLRAANHFLQYQAVNTYSTKKKDFVS